MTTDYAVLISTVADRTAARTLARTLVEKKLAACVQQLPIDSTYWWEGRIAEASEVMLICKIKRTDYAEAEAAILALHDYQTPEIVMLPIEAGFSAYLDWVGSVTK